MNLLKPLNKIGLWPHDIVLYVDGGLCSQMHFYLVGEMLRERGQRVLYDLRWFDYCGVDCDGRFARNYDLERAFPDIRLPRAGNLRCKLMRHTARVFSDYFDPEADPLDWIETTGPCYMEGYYRDPEEMYTRLFRERFRLHPEILDPANAIVLRRIQDAEVSASIHVRRGDLSAYNPAYGEPATVDYFLRAMDAVEREAGGRKVSYFMFSDEPEWCRRELGALFQRGDIEVVDLNGSDRGYFDLILMGHCRHQITSQGSMGKYAAMLRPEELSDGLVTLLPHKDESAEWVPRFQRVCVIDQGLT